MPFTWLLRRTTTSPSGPRTVTITSPSPSTAPNSSTSAPAKPVVMATRWRERSAITCCAWAEEATNRTANSAAKARTLAIIARSRAIRRGLCARSASSPDRDREEVERRRDQVVGDLARHRQHHGREQAAEILAAQELAGARPHLRAHDAADDEEDGEDDVDRVRRRRQEQRRHRRHEHDLELRGADDGQGRHAEQVDHGRHHDKAAADAHDRGEDADDEADGGRRDRADVKLRAAEA